MPFPPRGIHVTALAGRRPFKWVVTVDGEVIARCPSERFARTVRDALESTTEVDQQGSLVGRRPTTDLLAQRGRQSISRRAPFYPDSDGICATCGKGYQPLDVNAECRSCATARPNLGFNPLLNPMPRKR
jgi:hypothetical protein